MKFTDNGEVFVTVDCTDEEDEITLLTFEIKDTGIGIRPEDLHKLFQSFNQADASTTRKYGGTGLGLAISKELVKMMDGTIHVESILGKGSTFRFDVRLKIANRISEQKVVFEKLSGANVLLVDDNTNNRTIIGAYLKDVGCKVFEAEDADKAITTIIGNEVTNNKISVAVVDYQMPNMSGYELATTLKTIPFAKDVKLILLSSVGQEGNATMAKEMGFAAYLSKPVRRDELLNCIAVVLGLKSQEESRTIITKYTINEAKNALKPKILLVEDIEMNRKVVLKMFKAQNMTCDVAMDGNEALTAVAEKDYDIVLMDCQMPVMDGYESTKEIRKLEGNRKHTTIIAMTAHAMEGDRVKCIEAGMDDYISKPIKFEKLFKMIKESTKQNEQKSESFDVIYSNIDAFVKATGLNKDDVQELFADYINYLSNLLADIKDAINKGDFEKIRELAHSLKGSSGNLMITPIYECAMKIEDAAIKQEINECKKVLEDIQKLFH